MNRDEIKTELNRLFRLRYEKQFAELNKNVYKAMLTENGSFEAPMISLGNGGGVQIELGKKEVENLPAPAPVKVEPERLKSIKAVYRIALPFHEMEIAAKNPAYFNHLMDTVLSKALSNYAATWGGPEAVRFGTEYVTTSGIEDYADDFLITLSGSWALNERSYE